MKRIVVKIGTNVITRNDGSLDITQMSSLVDQISELHKNRFEVIMVSSGSVACGRSLLPGITENLDKAVVFRSRASQINRFVLYSVQRA